MEARGKIEACDRVSINNLDGSCTIVAVYHILRKTRLWPLVNEELQTTIIKALEEQKHDLLGTYCPLPPVAMHQAYVQAEGEDFHSPTGIHMWKFISAVVSFSPNMKRNIVLSSSVFENVPESQAVFNFTMRYRLPLFDKNTGWIWHNCSFPGDCPPVDSPALGDSEDECIADGPRTPPDSPPRSPSRSPALGDFVCSDSEDESIDDGARTPPDTLADGIMFFDGPEFMQYLIIYLTCRAPKNLVAGTVQYCIGAPTEGHFVAFVKCGDEVHFFNWGEMKTGTEILTGDLSLEFFARGYDFVVREVSFLCEPLRYQRGYAAASFEDRTL